MARGKENEHSCPYCGKNGDEVAGGICPACQNLALAISEDPGRMQRLWARFGPTLVRESMPETMELPDVLDGKRYRAVDRESNKWYLSVSEVNGQPVEIFASTAFDRDHELQSRISNLTTITRLVSLILRHISLGEQLTLPKILKQLKRSSRQRDDLPDMLFGVLGRYADKAALAAARDDEP
ncbi:MAG: hypothetical protein BWK76_19360 [Desulfobulbaceae bacterium A2]|nr:MAG: hypothetical protein BWK76_19360 [Desulfobulbaceae bacterium A2]